eukprot:jgi/Bigna1/135155/aug1.28_g9863
MIKNIAVVCQGSKWMELEWQLDKDYLRAVGDEAAIYSRTELLCWGWGRICRNIYTLYMQSSLGSKFVIVVMNTSKEQVEQLLAKQPEFSTLNFHQRPGKNPFAFAKFSTPQSAGKALAALSGSSLNGSLLKVTYARSEMKSSAASTNPSSYQS